MSDDDLASTVQPRASTVTTVSMTTAPSRMDAVVDRQSAKAQSFGVQMSTGNTRTGTSGSGARDSSIRRTTRAGRGRDHAGQDLDFTFQLPDLYSSGDSGDDSDDPGDPDPGPDGGADWGDLGEFIPSKGEALFIKESSKYLGHQPFDSYLRKFGHLADMCRVSSETFKSTLFLKIGGPVGTLINDMVPTKKKFRNMSGKQYAEAVRARLEPVTEKRLIYQQFLSRTQQMSEPVDLYLLDKFHLFKRSSKEKTRDFEDFMDQAIRGFINAYLKEKVREVCIMKPPKSFAKFREIVNKQVTFIQSRLQSNELDASEGQGVEVKLYSYSYLDAADGTESSASRYRLDTVKGVKEEKVNALEEEVEDVEDGVYWVDYGGRQRFQPPARGGVGRGGPARFQSFPRGGYPSQASVRGGFSPAVGGARPKTGFRAGEPQGKPKPTDNCFWCGGQGHWKNECPRRSHGLKKGVFAVEDGAEYDGDEDGDEGVDLSAQIAALTSKVNKLTEFMSEGRKVPKWGKADPQTAKNDGVHFLE